MPCNAMLVSHDCEMYLMEFELPHHSIWAMPFDHLGVDQWNNSAPGRSPDPISGCRVGFGLSKVAR